MNFEWDELKNQADIIKHGFDLAGAYRIFTLPVLVSLDEREEYFEGRWIGLDLLDSRVVVVVHTESEQNIIRIISLQEVRSRPLDSYIQLKSFNRIHIGDSRIMAILSTSPQHLFRRQF